MKRFYVRVDGTCDFETFFQVEAESLADAKAAVAEAAKHGERPDGTILAAIPEEFEVNDPVVINGWEIEPLDFTSHAPPETTDAA